MLLPSHLSRRDVLIAERTPVGHRWILLGQAAHLLDMLLVLAHVDRLAAPRTGPHLVLLVADFQFVLVELLNRHHL